MATPFPTFARENPILRRFWENFECKYLLNGDWTAESRGVKREYLKFGKRPYYSGIWAEVLAGKWGLGLTQAEVGEELGLERSRISDGLRKGEMSADIFMALRFNCKRPHNLNPSPETINAMNRGGFIGVARYLAGFVHDRKNLNPAGLNELKHELLCELLLRFFEWAQAKLKRDTSRAIAMVNHVCNNTGRDIVPPWCVEEDHTQVRMVVKRLSSDPEAAFRLLAELEENWLDIYVATTFVTDEGMRFTKDPGGFGESTRQL